MNKWTSEEVDLLVKNYNVLTNDDLYALFPNKTPYAVYKKAYMLGLRKSKTIEFENRSKARKGEKGANWKGGIKKNAKGYNLVLMPDHRRAGKGGYVLEHILVFERECGIIIPDNCCIHHLNGIKDDNRIENLCMMTHSAHTVLHHKGSVRSEKTREKISERKRRRK